jgi:hypothetical protein
MPDVPGNKAAERKAASVLERFLIFKDEPLFTGDKVGDRDAFNHEAFAETILNCLPGTSRRSRSDSSVLGALENRQS